jgi:uncharacterized membrane protein YeaQ/YmgE (transglycosylase-associated protein family)
VHVRRRTVEHERVAARRPFLASPGFGFVEPNREARPSGFESEALESYTETKAVLNPALGPSPAKSWLISLLLGLAGALLGYLIFTEWLGSGDTNALAIGGVIGAIILLPFVGVAGGVSLRLPAWSLPSPRP